MDEIKRLQQLAGILNEIKVNNPIGWNKYDSDLKKIINGWLSDYKLNYKDDNGNNIIDFIYDELNKLYLNHYISTQIY